MKNYSTPRGLGRCHAARKDEAMMLPSNFWDRPADERAERMREAAERGGVDNFFDLPPDERAQAYENSRDEVDK